jgi:hypothetical protein
MPAGHAVQLDALSSEKNPGGHRVQLVMLEDL